MHRILSGTASFAIGLLWAVTSLHAQRSFEIVATARVGEGYSLGGAQFEHNLHRFLVPWVAASYGALNSAFIGETEEQAGSDMGGAVLVGVRTPSLTWKVQPYLSLGLSRTFGAREDDESDNTGSIGLLLNLGRIRPRAEYGRAFGKASFGLGLGVTF
jgi:hypothetical protein